MIGVVVVRAMAQDDVGLPVADQAGDRAAVLERGHELAVVNVEHLVLDAENARAFGDFGLAALRERPAGLLEVADVAVGHGDELHLVAACGPERRHAARLELGIVGMGAEGDDAQRLTRWLSGCGLPGDERQQRDGQDRQTNRHATHTSDYVLVAHGL